ncbi:MAG: hypothetical protein ABJD68_06875 [Nakamurella sp.]
MTITYERGAARLAELGLSVDIVATALRRADADSAACSELDPPILEGLLRWGRTTKYLREGLLPSGWTFDNPRNLARTISPARDVAIVVATGNDRTGLADYEAGTRHHKGYATERAISTNGQLTFDLGELVQVSGSDRAAGGDPPDLWLLLFLADEDNFRAELSLPAAIDKGRITEWSERILLPVIPRYPDRGGNAPGYCAVGPATAGPNVEWHGPPNLSADPAICSTVGP